MRRSLIAVLAAAIAALALASVAQARKPPPVRYYVALGDSLAVGYQPHRDGTSSTTRQGYVDDLFAAKRRSHPGLRLVKFGCAGDSTVSFLNDPAACSYGTFRNQAAAANAFLRAHRRQIAFVTIDMGANDVDSCLKNGAIDLNCVNTGMSNVRKLLPKIGRGLRAAAGRNAQIVGMTYYDPFLENWLKGDSTDQAIAKASVQLADQFNKTIAVAYANQRIKVADVARAFQTDDFNTTTTLAGHGNVPVDVARICQFTYMCDAAPLGPNIHANPAGYRLIANTFARIVR